MIDRQTNVGFSRTLTGYSLWRMIASLVPDLGKTFREAHYELARLTQVRLNTRIPSTSNYSRVLHYMVLVHIVSPIELMKHLVKL